MFLGNMVNSNINMFNRNNCKCNTVNSSAINLNIANKINKVNNNNNNNRNILGNYPSRVNPRNTKDSISISAEGKRQSTVEQLLNKKQDIIDKKNKEEINSVEQGYDASQLLKVYDEEIQQIETQISQSISNDNEGINSTRNQNNNTVSNQKINYQQQRSEKDIQEQNLLRISNISSSNNLIEILSSVKSGIDNKVNVLENEMKIDSLKGITSDNKIELVSNLKSRSSKTLNNMGDLMNDVNNQFTQNLNQSKNIQNIDNSSQNDNGNRRNLNQLGQNIVPEMYNELKK